MIARSTIISVASLAWLLAGGPAAAGHKVDQQDRRTVEVDGQTTLVVKNVRGKTVVVGKSGLEMVSILVERHVKAKDAEQAVEIMAELQFEIEESADAVRVIAKYPKHLLDDSSLWTILKGDRPRASIDFTVEVPQAFDVEASTTSGDIQVTGIDGNALVSATSGDVFVRDIGGEASINLTSGSVTVEEVGGPCRIIASSGDAVVRRVRGPFAMSATSGNVKVIEVGGNCAISLVSGDISLDGCLGDVELTTSSGDAVIDRVDGSIVASSSSGDLNVRILPLGEKVFKLNSSSGDIDVFYTAPEEYGFLLHVNTATGQIIGDLDIELEKITRHVLKGIVGTGKSRVVIETANGDITIKEKNNGHDKHMIIKKKHKEKD